MAGLRAFAEFGLGCGAGGITHAGAFSLKNKMAWKNRIAHRLPANPSTGWAMFAPARISHHESGTAGLPPRRYKTLLIIPVSHGRRGDRQQAARGAGRTENGSRDFGGAEAPPFRQLPKMRRSGVRDPR